MEDTQNKGIKRGINKGGKCPPPPFFSTYGYKYNEKKIFIKYLNLKGIIYE
ncbi:hypothetical protein Arnit_2148 [Arcobacter nitrofigilis DSM 7299]|uniref:Uncharacterized protein n=1 Tax=Arcobacter nitrofigilis (strain ATCC 33309 / DSM 7299 / CCUG 15893 / LMG 7604 / NCTC 12251 / CI) TaxID=572480 RepID=D5V0I9_ARCNC|nr:hypothetical protein Arnit_2148 [Arcobacter nitrofigilis DSM 7299]